MNRKFYVSGLLAVMLCAGTVCAQAATIYLSDDAAHLYAMDTTTWQATKLAGTTEGVMYDIAFDATGSLYGITGGYNSKLYTLNTIGNFNNIGTMVGYTGINTANALTFSSSGTLYAANTAFSSNIFSIDASNGSSTVLGSAPRASAGDLEFDASGNLYMSGYRMANRNNQLVSVSLTGDPLIASGSVIDFSGTSYTGFGVQNMHGLAFADGTMYGFSGQNAYSINLSNGIASFVSAISGIDAGKIIYGAATQPASVPLPSAAWLLGSGLLGLIGVGRRRH